MRQPCAHQAAPRPASTTRGSTISCLMSLLLCQDHVACRSRSSSARPRALPRASPPARPAVRRPRPAPPASARRTGTSDRPRAGRGSRARAAASKGRCRQLGIHQERVGHDGAHRMHAHVVRTGVAAAVAEEAGRRLLAARRERASLDVQRTVARSRHGASRARRARPVARASWEAASLARCAHPRRRARARRARPVRRCAGTSAGATCRPPS